MQTPVIERARSVEVGVIHYDVIVIGAGVSGLGSASHLKKQCSDKTFVVLEAKETFGGTWHTHRYPGIRADSDLYTYGYRFKPWVGDFLATASEIKNYLEEVVEENDLDPHIRYNHHVKSASWSSEDNRWTLEVTKAGDKRVTFSANFLWMCQGYYRHDKGYTPDWPGIGDYEGKIVHPQNWPEGLDYKGQRVIVIGSGATAATMIPAIADECKHVTMLQRSPTYYSTEYGGLALLKELKELDIDPAWIHEIMRRKSLRDEAIFNERSLTASEAVKKELLDGVRSHLGPDYDIDTHFTPRYRPWRQRLAFVPGGDLFKAIRSGKVSVVTGEIKRFVSHGVELTSGDVIDADIVVTATGLQLSIMGDISFVVDGMPVDFADTVTYHGMMFTDIPNLAWVFGYLRASWTPRVDVVADFVCRLLGFMSANGFKKVTPQLPYDLQDLERRPWIDPENFNAGYIMRSLDALPKTVDHPEWKHTQNYLLEKETFASIDLKGGSLVYN